MHRYESRYIDKEKSKTRSRMIYGILLESSRYGINEVYGQEIWKTIVRELNLEHESFTTLGRYDDLLIEKIADSMIIDHK